MKISNLSRKSGVSVATIKFYLRERLLPPGVLTARNQAEYDERHLARLRFIRVLTGIGMMSLASVREVLGAIDDHCMSPQGLYRILSQALLAEQSPFSTTDPAQSAASGVEAFLAETGWQVDQDAPGRDTLVQVLMALQWLDCDCEAGVFVPYAQAAERLAARELDAMADDPATMVVAKTILFEVAFAVMRRMAYEHFLRLPPGRSARRDPD